MLFQIQNEDYGPCILFSRYLKKRKYGKNRLPMGACGSAFIFAVQIQLFCSLRIRTSYFLMRTTGISFQKNYLMKSFSKRLFKSIKKTMKTVPIPIYLIFLTKLQFIPISVHFFCFFSSNFSNLVPDDPHTECGSSGSKRENEC